MSVLVASNALMLQRAQTLQTLLNSGHWFALFSNDIDPTPATMLPEFLEANFSGYSPFDLTDQFAAPIREVDGEYVLTGNTGFFGCESGTQTIYGGYIHDGVDVKLSQRFDNPLDLTAGSSFTVPLVVQDLALSILPP